MGFRNSILGGVTLIRDAIQSQNYQAGSAGWSINQDGTAELNGAIIRGGVVVSGLALYYNGTPAAGNLIMSIAAAAGTDSFGNAYVKGVGLYGAQGQLTAKDGAGNVAKIAGNIGGGGLLAALPGLEMQLAANTGDPAAIGAHDDGSHTNLSLLLTSPSPVVGGLPGTNYAQVQLVGGDSAPPLISLDAANLTVNSAFNINSAGEIDLYAGRHDFVPAVVNAGSATWTVRNGYWVQMGPLRYVNVNFQVNAAGSGAGLFGFTLPFTVNRDYRQTLTMATESVGPNGSHIGTGECTFFPAGSGGTTDRLRTSSNDAINRDQNITGADLLAAGMITVTGWLLVD